MAIQKVSDLPIFRKSDPDFKYDRVKASLIEISYKISSDDVEGVSRYQSKAVTIAELADYILSTQSGGLFPEDTTILNGYILSGGVYLNQMIDDEQVGGYVISAKTGTADITALRQYSVNSPVIEISCDSFTAKTNSKTAIQIQNDNIIVSPRTEFINSVFVPPVNNESNDRCAVNLGYIKQAIPEIKSPFILFETKYLDYDSDALSASGWINTASGRWLSKNDFPAAYEHLKYEFDSIEESHDYTISYAGIATTVEAKKAKDGHIICDVEKINDINTIFNALGVAWVYIIDATPGSERFMLPRNSMFIRGCADNIQNAIGNYIPPTIPQHWHNFEYYTINNTQTDDYGIGGNHNKQSPKNFKQTSDILGLGDNISIGNTVSPPAIQMYLYMHVS